MRFLLDAGLPRATVELLHRVGHDAVDVRDIGMGAASDEAIAVLAKQQGRCLLTRDGDFGNIQAYPPDLYPGIVVVDLPNTARRDLILGVVEAFATDAELLALVPGRLAVVEMDRVRLRPPPP